MYVYIEPAYVGGAPCILPVAQVASGLVYHGAKRLTLT